MGWFASADVVLQATKIVPAANVMRVHPFHSMISHSGKLHSNLQMHSNLQTAEVLQDLARPNLSLCLNPF